MRLLEFLTITENSSGVTIQYRGQPKVAVKPARARSDVLMTIPTQAMDAAFKRDGESFYVGPGGTGAGIGNRYERFQQWIEENQEYEVPEVYVDERGIMSFTNGRHRYAVLRDAGVDPMPVAMSPEAIQNAQQLLKAELHEDDLYSDEVEPTYPNPLPSLSSDDPRFGQLFDRGEEAIFTVVEKLNFSAKGFKGAQDAVIRRYAKTVDIPIADLTCTEVNLYEDHLQRLIRGEGKKELPFITKMGDVFLINDGNHRVVAEHLKGNTTVRVKLLDIDALEEEFGIISEGILDALPPGARKLAVGLAMMAALSGAQGRESVVPHPKKHPDTRQVENAADRLLAMADIISVENPDRYGQWVSNLYDVYQSNPLAFKRMFGAEYEEFLSKARNSTPQEMGAYMKQIAQAFKPGITEARNPDVSVKKFGGGIYRAYLGRKKVGHAQLNDFKTDEVGDDERYIWKSVVHPDYLRKGIATELYNVIADDVAANGLKLVPSPDTQLTKDAYEFWKARDPESIKGHGKYKAEPYQKYIGKEIVVTRKGGQRPAVVTHVGWGRRDEPDLGIRYTDVPKGSVNSQSQVYLSAVKDQLR